MARDFFMSKTGHIEVQLIGGLTKIYFPLLPLCDRLDEDFQEQFRD